MIVELVPRMAHDKHQGLVLPAQGMVVEILGNLHQGAECHFSVG